MRITVAAYMDDNIKALDVEVTNILSVDVSPIENNKLPTITVANVTGVKDPLTFAVAVNDAFFLNALLFGK